MDTSSPSYFKMLKKRLEGFTKANDFLLIKNMLRGNPWFAIGGDLSTVTLGHSDWGFPVWSSDCNSLAWVKIMSFEHRRHKEQQWNGWKCRLWSIVGTLSKPITGNDPATHSFMGIRRWLLTAGVPHACITKWAVYNLRCDRASLKENTATLRC